MKRDMDLVKSILLFIENNGPCELRDLDLDGYEKDIVVRHVGLLCNAKLLDGEVKCDNDGDIYLAYVDGITWAGYEFLDLSRNNEIWQKTKSTLKEKAIALSMTALTELLKIATASAIQGIKL